MIRFTAVAPNRYIIPNPMTSKFLVVRNRINNDVPIRNEPIASSVEKVPVAFWYCFLVMMIYFLATDSLI